MCGAAGVLLCVRAARCFLPLPRGAAAPLTMVGGHGGGGRLGVGVAQPRCSGGEEAVAAAWGDWAQWLESWHALGRPRVSPAAGLWGRGCACAAGRRERSAPAPSKGLGLLGVGEERMRGALARAAGRGAHARGCWAVLA